MSKGLLAGEAVPQADAATEHHQQLPFNTRRATSSMNNHSSPYD